MSGLRVQRAVIVPPPQTLLPLVGTHHLAELTSEMLLISVFSVTADLNRGSMDPPLP